MADWSALVQAAEQAGLCQPECWNFNCLLDPEVQRDDDAWIRDAEDDDERERRQSVVDTNRFRVRLQLGRLHAFAELLRQGTSAAAPALSMPPPSDLLDAVAQSLQRSDASPVSDASRRQHAQGAIEVVAGWLDERGVGSYRVTAHRLRLEVADV